MNSIKQLYELQAIDSEIQENQNRLDDINRQVGESDQVLAQRANIADYENHLKDVRSQKQEMEWDIDELTKTINKLNEKLFSGKVQNPKELLDIEQDSKMHKGNLDKKEDGLLELLTEEEETEKKLAEATRGLDKMEKEWQESQKGLLDERSGIEHKLAELTKKRDEAAGSVMPADLKIYEGIRNRKEPAVCRIEQGRCQGCRLNLPVSQIQGARTGKLVQCTSCGRILYLG